MNLFLNKNKKNTPKKKYAERYYDYLNLSGRPKAEKIRVFLEKWFSKYPNKEKKELKARIMSSNPRHYSSAIFELILYAICTQLGYSVQVHPKLSNTSSKPDFLLSDPEGNEFYLEALSVYDVSDDGLAAKARKERLFDTINKLENKNFYLDVNTEGKCNKTPNGKELRNKLEQWLSSIDPDSVMHKLSIQGGDSLPRYYWTDGDWKITFIVFPKTQKNREKSEKIISSEMTELTESTLKESIRNAIVSKGKKYGKLDKPFLISVNVQSMFACRRDYIQVLVGQESFTYYYGSNFSKPEFKRIPNGVWYGRHGIRYTRISGVWFFKLFSPWNIDSEENTIYINPWAEKPLKGNVLKLPYVKWQDDKMICEEGVSSKDILNIDPNWPN